MEKTNCERCWTEWRRRMGRGSAIATPRSQSTIRGHIMESLLFDLRYAIRTLSRRPLFTTMAIITLALGIGANTSIFSLVNALLMRQLPFKHAERLVWVWSTRTDRDKAFFSIPDFVDYQSRTKTLDQMAAFANWGASLTGTGDAERLQGVRITVNAFQMLGVDALIGRTL